MNKKLLEIFSIIICVLLISSLTSCSTSSVKPNAIQIKRLVFLNQSYKTLDEVRIYISETREFASCGRILPGTECSTGFPLREYQGNHFDISWVDNQQSKSIKNIQTLVPEDLVSGKAVNAVIVFGAQGEFYASLKN